MDSAERRRVMLAVGLRSDRSWLGPYAILLALSVVVAVMGLSLNSVAVVIGAMLLAPLMTPVLGLSAGIAMALPRHLTRIAVIVVASTAGSVALAYGLALALPEGPLTSETLARTSPDLRDLLVALAAGAAGAYATVRRDVSSSLTGVAVAVALVPPLATIGITLEAGRGDLASGAALLYAANLTAIVAVGVAVFLATGFVPLRRLQMTRTRVAGAGFLAASATVAIAVPLTLTSVRAAEQGRERDSVQAAVEQWLSGTANELDEVRIDDGVVRIRISGPTPPPATGELDQRVGEVVGEMATTQIRWTQSQAPVAEPEVISPPEADVTDAVRREVQAWLGAEQAAPFDIDRIEVGGDQVVIDLRSTVPPPPVDDLADRLGARLQLGLPVVVNWTERATTRSGSEAEVLRRRVERAARDWADTQDGVTIGEVDVDTGAPAIDVEVVGPDPGDTESLRLRLREEAGPDTTISIWYVPRLLLPDTDPP